MASQAAEAPLRVATSKNTKRNIFQPFLLGGYIAKTVAIQRVAGKTSSAAIAIATPYGIGIAGEYSCANQSRFRNPIGSGSFRNSRMAKANAPPTTAVQNR